MPFHKWYNVKTDKNRTIIKQMIDNKECEYLEFNRDLTQIRKVDTDFET